MKYRVLLLILPVVIAAGCIDTSGWFGGNVISLVDSTTRTGADDILIAKDVLTIPNPPVLPNQPMTLTFTLKDMDALQTAENVKVDLYDAPLFRSNYIDNSGKYPLCNSNQQIPLLPACLPDPYNAPPGTQTCSMITPCRLIPGEEKQITYSLRSPAQDEIAGIKTDTALNYRIFYDAKGSFTYTIPAVDMNEILLRQRATQKTTLTRSKAYGPGPIKIDADIQGVQYVLVDQDSVILFTLTNKGSGTVNNSQIEPMSYSRFDENGLMVPDYGMTVEFPPGAYLPEYAAGDTEYIQPEKQNSPFACNLRQDGGWECFNVKPIQIYKDKSQVSLRFVIRVAPQNLAGAPFKSYTITSSIGYMYELRNSIPVTINPFQNVR